MLSHSDKGGIGIYNPVFMVIIPSSVSKYSCIKHLLELSLDQPFNSGIKHEQLLTFVVIFRFCRFHLFSPWLVKHLLELSLDQPLCSSASLMNRHSACSQCNNVCYILFCSGNDLTFSRYTWFTIILLLFSTHGGVPPAPRPGENYAPIVRGSKFLGFCLFNA